MNSLSSLKSILLAASLALAAPVGAFADSMPGAPPDRDADGPGRGHEMAGCMMGHGMSDMHHGEDMLGDGDAIPPMLRHLQLTEAQQDKVFAIVHAQAPQAREFRKAIRKAYRGLHELVTGTNYDEAKAKALTDALGKATADSALLHARTHRQIFDVLTPEQRQMLARHGEHGPDGMHGGRHDGDRGAMPPH